MKEAESSIMYWFDFRIGNDQTRFTQFFSSSIDEWENILRRSRSNFYWWLVGRCVSSSFAHKLCIKSLSGFEYCVSLNNIFVDEPRLGLLLQNIGDPFG